MARTTSLLLKAAIAVLMLDAALEMALISSTVYWLHHRAGQDFLVTYASSTLPLHGKPVGLLADQGHTSNGAAGTAFVACGLGGILALVLRRRDARAGRPTPRTVSTFFYNFWLTLCILNTLLCLAALIYTFSLTATYSGQKIDLALASQLDNRPYPDYVAYPTDFWTPENWLKAVLALPLASSSDRADIHVHWIVQEVWRWNLVPLFILQSIVCVLAVLDWRRGRRERLYTLLLVTDSDDLS
ncbi:hypothetical protein LTR53_001828 [Teratosphaeriaceae sp. CCFEE 6253]|nr:hypothetical protein LTR53_001828 [Teratosphaeriaceae sp. CCFEE 6253]